MKDIIKISEPQYIIIREKDNRKEYFSSANIYGKDDNGVLRVINPKWSKRFLPISSAYNLNRMKEILNGMYKYGKIENQYTYVIAKIQTTTAIIDYIISNEEED